MGATTTNGLQVLQPLATVSATQAGRWKSVSWGSLLQMAFKSSNHLQLCRLPKLDAGGASVGVHYYKWPSCTPSTCSRADYPSWTLEERQLGFTTTNGLPSSPPTTCSRANYPSWMLKERQLGVTTINGLHVLLPLAAMPTT